MPTVRKNRRVLAATSAHAGFGSLVWLTTARSIATLPHPHLRETIGGSRIVFLIDWNHMRKWLRGFVDKTRAIDLLEWRRTMAMPA